MSRFARHLGCALVLLACLPSALAGQTVRLAGHVAPWAAAGRDTGPVDPETVLPLTFVLNRPADRQAAFDRLLAAQQDPASPSFHRWLAPGQIGKLYGPAESDIAALTGWLAAQGIVVAEIAPSRVFLHARAPAGTVARALGARLRMVAAPGSSTPRLAALTAPALPSAIAPLVASIGGLTDTPVVPDHHSTLARMPVAAAQPHATSSSTGEHFLAPADFALIYNLNPAYHAGLNGAGQRVAVIGRSRVLAADIGTFETLTGLPAAQPTVIVPPAGTDPGTTNTDDQGEATLDVDRVLSTAPGAAVDLVVSASSAAANGLYIAAQYQVQTLRDPVMNISFSQCEAAVGPSGVALWDTLFAQAAAEGITVTVSSGDAGAGECQTAGPAPATPSARGVNALCASSYATCVGGTEFADFAAPATYWTATNSSTLLSALSYIPEGAWNEPTSTANGVTTYYAAATSGGASTVIPKPAWQTGTGVPADGARDLPDVAFSASLHNAYIGCLAYTGADCVSHYTLFDGTSTAAPAMAGIAALLDGRIGGPQGNLNPLLYRLAGTAPAVFHDATAASSGVPACDPATPSMCNNTTPLATGLTGGVPGFVLTAGYDQATGLGSLDAAAFLNAAAAATTVSLSPAAASLTLHPGATAGNTDTLALASSFYTGNIALTCSVAYNGTGVAAFAPTCKLNPASVALTGSGTATSTLIISTTAPGGHVRLTPPALHPPPPDRPALAYHWPAPAPPHSAPIIPIGLCSLVLIGLLPSRRLSKALAVRTAIFPLTALLVMLTACSGSSTPAASNPLLVSTSATALIAASTSLIPGASTTFTATVANSGFNTVTTPTGSVDFYQNGAATPTATAALAQGVATTAIAFPTAGTYTVAAVYRGDANFSGSSSTPVALAVTPNGTTLGSYTVTVRAAGSGAVAASTTVALTLN